MEPEHFAEFVDQYDNHCPRPNSFRPHEQEPWRQHAGALLLPVSFVRMVADPREQNKILRNEMDQVGELCAQIINLGLQTPVLLKVDSGLRCVLKDGNHRLIAFEQLGYQAIPTVIKYQDEIRGFAVSLLHDAPALFAAISEGLSGVKLT